MSGFAVYGVTLSWAKEGAAFLLFDEYPYGDMFADENDEKILERQKDWHKRVDQKAESIYANRNGVVRLSPFYSTPQMAEVFVNRLIRSGAECKLIQIGHYTIEKRKKVFHAHHWPLGEELARKDAEEAAARQKAKSEKPRRRGAKAPDRRQGAA